MSGGNRRRNRAARAGGTTPAPPVTPPTITTTVNPQGSGGTAESFVVDISTNPFLRTLPVAFRAQSLRPQRAIYYFFDDVNVSKYVQRADVLSVGGRPTFNDTWGNPDIITYLANSAAVLKTGINLTTGNVDLYLSNVIGTFPDGVTVTGSFSGATGTVTATQHRHGNASAGGANSVTLALGASTTTGYYLGNVIYLVSGSGAGQTGTIMQYNGVTRAVNVATNWTIPPTTNTKYSIGEHRVERDGSSQGVFVIPNLPTLKFRAGERIFRVIDTVNGTLDDATTRADFRFLGTGLTEVKRDIVIQRPQQPAPPPPTPVTPAPRPPTSVPVRVKDPVAQTFFVDEQLYPGGMFLTSAQVFFGAKDPILPVIVQIRPVVNGFPHSSEILKGGEIYLDSNRVKTSTLPNVQNSQTATLFTFPTPLYLEPGGEYAMIILTDSLEYTVYVSELGKKIIGSSRLVSTQPYLGSFFKSQNQSTWTPVQEEDLMFVLKKAVFSTTTSGTITMYNQKPTTNINVDSMYIYSSEDVYSNTTLLYGYSKDSGGSFANTATKRTDDLDTRFIIPAATDGVYRVRATLATKDRNLSPVLYTEKFTVVGSENLINNLPLDNSSVTIINGGVGYTVPTSISVVITGGGGTGANAFVSAVSGGAVTQITFNSVGSGYTGQANLSIVGGGATTVANAVVSAENRSSGGPGAARYITRMITLAEGFDAGDIRAFITAYKPLNTDVNMYYKIRNLADPEDFSQKRWAPMTQKTPTSAYSDTPDDIIEFEYLANPNTASLVYSSGLTSYDRFQQFAIKLVLRSSTTTVVPMIYDLRAIALPPSGA